MKLFQRRSSMVNTSSSSSPSSKVQAKKRPRVHKSASCGMLMSSSFHDSSTATSDDSQSQFASSPLPPPRRRVHFDDKAVQYFDSPWLLSLDHNVAADAMPILDEDNDETAEHLMLLSCKSTWYRQQDVSKFKHEAQVYARLVINRERHEQRFSGTDTTATESTDTPVPWSEALWTAYRGLHNAENLDAMHAVMAQARQVSMDPLCVGLERWALPALKNSRYRQRQALVRAILARQAVADARYLRRISREHSRPCRLFAAYLGRAVHEN